MPRPARSVPPWVICLILLSRTAGAQFPQPKLAAVFPPGGQAGSTVEVAALGDDVNAAGSTLWFSHPGIKATSTKPGVFNVSVSKDVPLGFHDVRSSGPLGISNPRVFVVSERRELKESEPNQTLAGAGTFAVNTVVNGVLTSTDFDLHAFEGKKGQRLFLEVEARRIDSPVDATLRLLDSNGRELFENRDAFGPDPFLDVTLPADGKYYVKVHDVVHDGSPSNVYRLILSDGPRLDAARPSVVSAAGNMRLSAVGRALGGASNVQVLDDGGRLESKPFDWTIPRDRGHSSLFTPTLAAGRVGFDLRVSTASGSSNAIFLAEGTDPVVEEREPNEPDQPQPVSLPCEISGTFGATYDLDVYRFNAKKGEVWRIDAWAERLGSPADPSLIVQRVPEKGAPQDLASADDIAEPGLIPRLSAASIDAAVRFQAPEDGTYQVVMNDLYNTTRGDPRFFYRLSIRRERPDFLLFLVPASPNAIDSLVVRAGGRASAYVLVQRIDGFAGAIRVEASKLPEGVRCEPVVISAGQSIAPIVFEADSKAKPVDGVVELLGRSRWGDRKDSPTYVSGASPLVEPIERSAVSAAMVSPPNAQANPPLTPARVTRGFVIAVREGAPFSLVASAPAVVAQGSRLPIDLTLERRSGFTEALQITAADQPANFTTAPLSLAKEAKTGVFPVYVAKATPPGTYTFVLRGAGPFPFSKDPNAKPKPNITVNEPSGPITVVVRPSPVNLSANPAANALAQGGTLTLSPKIARQNGFAGDVTLDLLAPDGVKLSAEPVTIPAPGLEAKIQVVADRTAAIGAVAQLYLRARANVRGETVEVHEPLTLTINKP